MGRHIAQVVDAVDQPIVVMAQNAIAAGDLVKIDLGGWASKVSDQYPVAIQNAVAGPTSASPAVPVGSNYGWGGNAYAGGLRNIAALPDGGFALAYSGNGTTPSQGANVAFYNPNSVVRQVVVLSGASSTGPIRVVRAGADNVAVVWSEGTDLRIAVVNHATGAVVLASVSVGVVTSNQLHSWNINTLTSGEVIVAYPSSGSMAFKRFNASGVLQGAEVPVEAGQAPLFITILALAAGGFVLRWAKTSATAGNRMAKFNASGVVQGTVVQISSDASGYDGVSQIVGAMEGKLIELANGNIVSSHIAGALLQGFKLYDSSLALLNTVALAAPSANTQDVLQLAAKHGGGFWLQGSSGVSYKLQEYSNAGLLVREASTGVAYAFRIIDRPGNGPVLLAFLHNPSTPSSSMQAVAYQASLVAEAAGTFVYNNASLEIGFHWGESLASGLLQFAWNTYSNGVTTISTLFPGAASVLGVAQGAASVGQSVRVATAGKLAMNQSLTAPAFDRRASTPPGSKGSTVGAVALLSGLVG